MTVWLPIWLTTGDFRLIEMPASMSQTCHAYHEEFRKSGLKDPKRLNLLRGTLSLCRPVVRCEAFARIINAQAPKGVTAFCVYEARP